MKVITNIYKKEKELEVFPCFRINGWGNPVLFIDKQNLIVFDKEKGYSIYSEEFEYFPKEKLVEKVSLDYVFENTHGINLRNKYLRAKKPILFISYYNFTFKWAVYFPEFEVFLVIFRNENRPFEIRSLHDFASQLECFNFFSLDFTLKIDIQLA